MNTVQINLFNLTRSRFSQRCVYSPVRLFALTLDVLVQLVLLGKVISCTVMYSSFSVITLLCECLGLNLSVTF